ncbi:hypothetical protein COCMIDRAFT_84181 [Bipolaris oryzae ATCC 44560]|uniref:Uncharacterized protein n=1 Tax=Bipolaris oryzae ATCC 44560 TaxID=930090 RepID=W7A0L7_COCMI|nr:uncharacterized protein COCMIDRAFT_84181 [Bipolaris oryzae ATCC 44560]EUC49581.1 hypothetical protein COCMIDRAFT_84181 [Bipolaris oryzae ATCC 44560]
MGKNRNRNRNKNRAKKAKGGGGEDGETSKTPAKILVDKQKDVKEPEKRGASDEQDAALLEAPIGNSKARRDSVISSTSESAADQVHVVAQVTPRSGWNFRIRLWLWLWRSWPCRLLRWTYCFLLALVRIDWNDQRRAADLLLAVGLAGSVVFGVCLVVDFVVKHSEELRAVFPAKWFLEAFSGIRVKVSVLQVHCQKVLRGDKPWVAAWSAYPNPEDGT